MFESLFGTISDFLINGKLNQDSKKKYYDKYIEIGCSLADRIKEQLINENFVRTGESGGKVLHMVPDWFGKIDFISSLTFGAAEIQRNKLETLHLFSLFKKTTIQRKYVNQHSPGKKLIKVQNYIKCRCCPQVSFYHRKSLGIGEFQRQFYIFLRRTRLHPRTFAHI